MAEQQALLPAALRWRCRRGMLELDLMLLAFADKEVQHLTNHELMVFDRLLDYPDQTLLELFLGQIHSSDKEIAQFVKRIRQSTNA
ncbi:MAG: succinate dehydrogenase assembly factor 2 [Gammaproteobacteria bacterium]|nr:succinate dehydrogenase assembly factor 2 [Gammaproteobacteria bacterium]